MREDLIFYKMDNIFNKDKAALFGKTTSDDALITKQRYEDKNNNVIKANEFFIKFICKKENILCFVLINIHTENFEIE